MSLHEEEKKGRSKRISELGEFKRRRRKKKTSLGGFLLLEIDYSVHNREVNVDISKAASTLFVFKLKKKI